MLSSGNLIVLIATFAIEVGAVYILIWGKKIPGDPWLCATAIIVASFFQWIVWRSSKISIQVTNTQLILKRSSRIFVAAWQDILRIEEVWGTYSGGRSYFVRTPHSIIGIPGTMERCDELMAIIQQRSGKRIISEWRGAKDSLREEWRAWLRWLATHRLAVALIVLCLAGLGALAMRWLRSTQ